MSASWTNQKPSSAPQATRWRRLPTTAITTITIIITTELGEMMIIWQDLFLDHPHVRFPHIHQVSNDDSTAFTDSSFDTHPESPTPETIQSFLLISLLNLLLTRDNFHTQGTATPRWPLIIPKSYCCSCSKPRPSRYSASRLSREPYTSLQHPLSTTLVQLFQCSCFPRFIPKERKSICSSY